MTDDERQVQYRSTKRPLETDGGDDLVLPQKTVWPKAPCASTVLQRMQRLNRFVFDGFTLDVASQESVSNVQVNAISHMAHLEWVEPGTINRQPADIT